MPSRIAFIVGNGLTIDLLRRSDNPALNSSQPLSFEFDVPFGSGMPWREAFPLLEHRLSEVRNSHPGVSDFDAFEALPEITDFDDLDILLAQRWRRHPRESANDRQQFILEMLNYEVRQFLVFAYSHLQAEMDLLDNGATPWAYWIHRHSAFLHLMVSFNYDLLLEDLLQRAVITTTSPNIQDTNITYDIDTNLNYAIDIDLRRMGIIQRPLPLLLKPHGSIDFAHHPSAISVRQTPTYPSTSLFRLNNTPLIRVARRLLGTPRVEPYVVLPKEYSPYINFQWVRPGYQEFYHRASFITHCVFLGLSYWESDRLELNYLLDAFPSDTVIIEANPSPNPAFRTRVVSSGRCYVHWNGEPLDIT